MKRYKLTTKLEKKLKKIASRLHTIRTVLTSCWNTIKPYIVTVSITIGLFLVVLAAILIGYLYNWTGFNTYTDPNTKPEFYRPMKTLWDWLQLLIIPLVLAMIVPWLNWILKRQSEKNAEQQKERDQAIEKKRAETEQEIAKDNQQEKALQEYLDRISELILEKHIRDSKPGDEVRTIAYTRTITLFPRLDGRRKGDVLQFLSKARLISNIALKGTFPDHIIELKDADLKDARLADINLTKANLRFTDLRNTFLINVDLSEADLSYSDLRDAVLTDVDLSKANLVGTKWNNANLGAIFMDDADLSNADLSGVNLSEVDLNRVNLNKATLVGTDLSYAYLDTARLSEANLKRANLTSAHMSSANLSYADLSGAILTDVTLEDTALIDIVYDDTTIWPDGFTPPPSYKETL